KCWNEFDIEKLKEELDLTEEEEARLDELVGEIQGLKEQMKEALEEVKDIIGPKISEKAEEIREECGEIAEQMKPLLEQLKDLHIRLKEALEAGNEEDIATIKAEMEEVTAQLQAVKQELAESDCSRVLPPKAKERVEAFREKIKGIHERVREAFKSRVEKRACARETWEELSEEDQETLKALQAEIIELKKDIEESFKQQDQDRVEEIRGKIAQLMEEIRNLYVESGLASCFRS
ncbi:MAG: hypothetical protein HXS50_01865, partial [Theionarchaea archaeon]|nr:hypothetical protein [Theionarchaea archaeon]